MIIFMSGKQVGQIGEDPMWSEPVKEIFLYWAVHNHGAFTKVSIMHARMGCPGVTARVSAPNLFAMKEGLLLVSETEQCAYLGTLPPVFDSPGGSSGGLSAWLGARGRIPGEPEHFEQVHCHSLGTSPVGTLEAVRGIPVTFCNE